MLTRDNTKSFLNKRQRSFSRRRTFLDVACITHSQYFHITMGCISNETNLRTIVSARTFVSLRENIIHSLLSFRYYIHFRRSCYETKKNRSRNEEKMWLSAKKSEKKREDIKLASDSPGFFRTVPQGITFGACCFVTRAPFSAHAFLPSRLSDILMRWDLAEGQYKCHSVSISVYHPWSLTRSCFISRFLLYTLSLTTNHLALAILLFRSFPSLSRFSCTTQPFGRLSGFSRHTKRWSLHESLYPFSNIITNTHFFTYVYVLLFFVALIEYQAFSMF